MNPHSSRRRSNTRLAVWRCLRVHVLIEPMVDRRNKRIQLRPPDCRLALVTGRRRIGQHLGNTVARYVEMLCCLASAHPFRNSPSHLHIKFQGVYPLSLLPSIQKETRWSDFTPPAAGLSRRYRGRSLRRRSHRWLNSPLLLIHAPTPAVAFLFFNATLRRNRSDR